MSSYCLKQAVDVAAGFRRSPLVCRQKSSLEAVPAAASMVLRHEVMREIPLSPRALVVDDAEFSGSVTNSNAGLVIFENEAACAPGRSSLAAFVRNVQN